MISNRCTGKRTLMSVAIGMVCLALPVVAGTKTVRVNLGTIAPRGSTYHRALQAMAERWRDLSDGSIRVVIYPDGTLGGESDMVRLMRVGTLHASLVTGIGLMDIEPTVAGLQNMPLRFRDLGEFDYVNQQLGPVLKSRIEERGFVVLGWGDAGWVRYFSKVPILSPDDLRSQKVFAWEGDPEQIKMMRAFGLNPIALDTGDIPTGLKTGLIDVATLPPVYALAGQVDQLAPHMLALNWAPLVGALIMDRKTWLQIPVELHAGLLEAAATACEQMRTSSREESEEAVAAMEKRGLQVHTLSPEQEARWWQEAEADLLPRIRGTMVPAETFDQVQQIIEQYRSGTAPSGE